MYPEICVLNWQGPYKLVRQKEMIKSDPSADVLYTKTTKCIKDAWYMLGKDRICMIFSKMHAIISRD